MTAAGDLTPIEMRLDELSDLFRRRLLDDRTKRAIIDEMSERLRIAEHGQLFAYLQPLLTALGPALDRLTTYSGPDVGFVASVREEILDALTLYGIEEIPPSGLVDPRLHEVQVVERSDGSVMEIASVSRVGLRRGSEVVRAARVVARRTEPLAGD